MFVRPKVLIDACCPSRALKQMSVPPSFCVEIGGEISTDAMEHVRQLTIKTFQQEVVIVHQRVDMDNDTLAITC